MSISRRVQELWSEHPDRRAVEYGSQWWSWGELAALADGFADAPGVDLAGPVGIVMRERPQTVAALLAVLGRGGTAHLITPLQSDAALADDVSGALAPVVVACSDDWERGDARARARAGGVVAVELPLGDAQPRTFLPSCARSAPRASPPGRVAISVLSSGTTGTPKRIPIPYAFLDGMLGGDPAPDPREARGATINTLPLVSVGGMLGVISSIWRGRPIALMERFSLEEWVALIAEHRPRRSGAPPAVMRMVLDAGIAPEAFESVECFETGSAPVDPELATHFEERYGLAVLPSYGATEFVSSVAGWSLEEWQRWRKTKRGSVGRARPGFRLRVVDDEDREVATGEPGRLEVLCERRLAHMPEGWVRTNDLARCDADGFLWILGRLDDVIIRGGFKVPIAEVEDVLSSHPAVAEAVVVGVPDTRLGQVPSAAVVLAPGAETDEASLISYARRHLAPYKSPVEVLILDRLPRNAMMKIVRADVRRMLEERRSNG